MNGSDLSNFCEVPSYPAILSETADTTVSKVSGPVIKPYDIELNKRSFTLTCKGEKPVYCGRPKVSGVAVDGSGLEVTNHVCHRAMCPSCGPLWEVNKVFKYAVLLECYAASCGSRPAVGEASLDPSKDYTLKDLRDIEKTINRKLKRGGVDAFLKVFHPYRIKDHVKDSIRRVLRENKVSSQKFWKFIKRDDALDLINADLGTNYGTFYDIVNMGMHEHIVMFPNYAKPTGDSDLVIRKEQYGPNARDVKEGRKKEGAVKILASMDDVVKHLYYLVSHCGLSNSRKFQNEPFKPGGELFRFKPDELLGPERVDEIRQSVLDFLNMDRERPLVYDSEEDKLVLSKPENEDEDKPEIDPIGSFLAFRDEQKAYIEDYIDTVFVDSENADYVKTVVNLLWDLQSCKISGHCKHVYTQLLPPPPDGLKLYGVKDAEFNQVNYDKLNGMLTMDGIYRMRTPIDEEFESQITTDVILDLLEDVDE